MPWLALLGGLVGAGGSIAGGLLGQKKGNGPNLQTVPLPPYAQAVNRYIARLYASNVNAQPPSFGDYVKSGGTATFPIRDPGFTPLDLQQLGFIDAQGNPSSFLPDTQHTDLTTEQKLFLGQQLARRGGTGLLASAYRKGAKADRIQGRLDAGVTQHPDIATAKVDKLRNRSAYLIGRTG